MIVPHRLMVIGQWHTDPAVDCSAKVPPMKKGQRQAAFADLLVRCW
jgi:hypothetical protein